MSYPRRRGLEPRKFRARFRECRFAKARHTLRSQPRLAAATRYRRRGRDAGTDLVIRGAAREGLAERIFKIRAAAFETERIRIGDVVADDIELALEALDAADTGV